MLLVLRKRQEVVMKNKSIGILELARQAGLSINSTYLVVRNGQVLAHKDAKGRWLIDQAEAKRFLKERSARMPRKSWQVLEYLKNLNFDDILKFLKFLALIAIAFRCFGHENIGIEKWLEFMTLLISI
jgi:hypothetical protein